MRPTAGPPRGRCRGMAMAGTRLGVGRGLGRRLRVRRVRPGVEGVGQVREGIAQGGDLQRQFGRAEAAQALAAVREAEVMLFVVGHACVQKKNGSE